MSKCEIEIPFENSNYDTVEFIANGDSAQMNILIDGTCAFRIHVNKYLEFELVYHETGEKIFETNLEKIWENDLNHEDERETELFEIDLGEDI